MGDFYLFCPEWRLCLEENRPTSVKVSRTLDLDHNLIKPWQGQQFLYFIYLGKICWGHVLFFSNTLLHICTVEDGHTWDLPSCTTAECRVAPLGKFGFKCLIQQTLDGSCLGRREWCDFIFTKQIFTKQVWDLRQELSKPGTHTKGILTAKVIHFVWDASYISAPT